jgi:eukaryotic-like serine/threonine-protein kinase
MANGSQKITRLGRYDLREEIGRGGMATVYRGYDSTLKRDVAVKVLHPHLVSHEEARARFEREARSVARLHHNSIVEIYDYAEAESGEVYIVMELVDGYTLREFLLEHTGHPLMAEGAALIARQIFVALKAAHAKGIVHRDVKPENILISKNGQIQLSDFGIAFLAGIGQMTATGQILGSPTYMSPEHIESPTVDARADIFSLGTILYEMTVGLTPFVGNNPHQIIKRVVEGYYDHPLSVNPSVGHPLASIIVKCLQQQPERRYQTADEAIEDLDFALTQMGLTDFEKEQMAYIANPNGWEQDHIDNIVARTLQMGKDAQKHKHLPEAMNHLNRVLAIEPDNEAALGIVNVLSRRRQIRRNMERIGSLVAVAAVVLIVLAGIVLYRWDQPSPPSATRDTESSPDIPGLPDTTSIAESDTVSITDSAGTRLPGNRPNGIVPIGDSETDTSSEVTPDSDSEPLRRMRPHPVEVQRKRTVIFNPIPMSVDILIDDSVRFTFKATDRARDLDPGNHNIKFIPVDDRLETLTETITVESDDAPLTVPARLRWKPGKLLVKSNIETDVAVNGRALGRTNSVIELDIKNGPTTQFRILLSARGYHPTEKLVSVSAGKTTEIVVQLESEHP